MNATVVDSVSDDLLLRLDATAPRYTSFPPVDRFVEAFSVEHYIQALQLRHCGAAAMTQALSLYVHIPFCDSLCYYCACNQITTRHHDRGATYLRYLSREVDLHVAHLGAKQIVSQLQLGGGSPTCLSDDELRELMAMLRRNFNFAADGDYAIEVDPRTVDATRLNVLAGLGFNSLSFGVQDFDPAVQKAVNRVQPVEQVFSVVGAARLRGFESISLDLMYGLPLQSPESFDRTLAQLMQLRPQRITLYAYTHLPARYKPHRSISAVELPSASAKATMQFRAQVALRESSYVNIGMDHFVLATDPLAIAKRQGRLHRDFQGYVTHPDGDLIGLGVSAMGHIGATYSQNARTMDAYCDHLDQGVLPVERGLGLSRDDLVRRAVIMSLMCHGEVLFESIELAHLVTFRKYFAAELEALFELAEQGVVTVDESGIQVTAAGESCVQAVAMVFDRYLQADRARARFSRII